MRSTLSLQVQYAILLYYVSAIAANWPNYLINYLTTLKYYLTINFLLFIFQHCCHSVLLSSGLFKNSSGHVPTVSKRSSRGLAWRCPESFSTVKGLRYPDGRQQDSFLRSRRMFLARARARTARFLPTSEPR